MSEHRHTHMRSEAHPVARIELCLDVHDLDRATEFWTQALGYVLAGEAGQYRALSDPNGQWPRLLLQRTDDVKHDKNRMHLDLHVADIEREAGRLVELGATRIDADPMDEAGARWIRLLDPEGNELCVCRWNEPG